MDKKRLKFVIIVITIGILYYIEIKTIGFSIPCLFYQTTGFKCPGCGITTAILAILRGDFQAAFAANMGLAILSVPLGIFLLYILIKWLWHRPLNDKIINIVAILFIILLILWGIARNMLHI